MEPPDTMLAVVRAAYERGRIVRALGTSAWVIPMVVASFGGCGDARVSVAVGVVLFVLAFATLWRGGAGARAVKPGLVAGIASLAFPLVACRALERAGIDGLLPLASCVAGGVVSGVIVSHFASREANHRPLFLFVGGLVATLAGALGCLGAGFGGVVAMILALAATVPFGLRADERRA